ncbi:NAPEP-like protein [Mya arenaria]|uniref:NAPEP-like protein n=2 Tax=Mya arenaria TaxID=6604 RepID=A0ABY7EQC4_MYAAR|nr:NAPEP-like protein [Mya arenaria]
MAEDSDVPEKFLTKKGRISFRCGWKAFSRPGPLLLLDWTLEPNNSGIPWNDLQAIQRVHPVLDYDFQKVNNPPQDKIQITWIGHATVLVQMEGKNILADPVFSEKCGPAGFGLQLGYTRFRCPACQVEDLPPIHVVLISHNHHDHLDSQSVRDIAKHHPDAKWLVGSGNAKFCKTSGCKDVEELKWWEPKTVGAFTFVCTPTQHWCLRYPDGFNHALWCGWVVKSPNFKYYFGGDTGYQDELFKLIGRKYGPFDLAAIPIGSYEPRYITELERVNPEEAVDIHKDINSRVSIGIHWGTFELTNEYFLEPPQRLEKEMYNRALDPKTFFNLRIGETWVVGENRDYNPPFMEREKEGTPRLTNGPFDGDLSGYKRETALQKCESDHLHRTHRICQDIKTKSEVQQTERSNPKRISADEPSPHNNHADSATGMKPTGRSKPRRSLSPDAPSPSNNQDSASGIKLTGRSKPRRSLSPDAPSPRNNQDSASGIKPTGRSARDR